MKPNNLLRYLALALGLLYATLMILLAMDSFPSHGTMKEFLGFLINISPGLIIAIASVYGYFRPKYGRILFLVISIVYTLYYNTYKNVGTFMGLSFPLIVITIILLLASLPVLKKQS
jgi:hypothetical protein